jgi:hypothetical protein
MFFRSLKEVKGMRKLLAVSLLGLAWMSQMACLGPPPPPATPEQAQWYAQRDAQSPSFTLPAEENERAWARAKIWIASYSDFKLQTIDESILETYYPPGESDVRFGFQVTRIKVDDQTWRFNVRAVTGNAMAGNTANWVAQALALYMRTGMDCPPPNCGAGFRGRPNRL